MIEEVISNEIDKAKSNLGDLYGDDDKYLAQISSLEDVRSEIYFKLFIEKEK